MQYLPFGTRAAVLVLAVASAPSCASGGTDSVIDTSDANGSSSDGGGTTYTSSDGGAASDMGSDGGAASDTGYAFESDGGGDEEGYDASEGDDASDGSTGLGETAADASTDASSGGSDDADTAAPPQTGLSVLYEVQDPAAMSAYIGCELSITNSGTGSPELSDLKARYYYTDEVQLTPQITINWSHVSTSGADGDLAVTSSVVPVVPAVTDADTYIEFSFSSNSSPALTPGESAVFSWQLQGPTPSQDIYTQTNDYSFDASTTTLTSSTHIVLLQSGTVVWGLTP